MVDHTITYGKLAQKGEESRNAANQVDPDGVETDTAYRLSKEAEHTPQSGAPQSAHGAERRTHHGQHASEPEAGQQPEGRGNRGAFRERFEGAMKDIGSKVLEARGMPLQDAPSQASVRQAPPGLGGLRPDAADKATQLMAGLQEMGLRRTGGTSIDGARPGDERAQGAARQEQGNLNPAKKSTMAQR